MKVMPMPATARCPESDEHNSCPHIKFKICCNIILHFSEWLQCVRACVRAWGGNLLLGETYSIVHVQ